METTVFNFSTSATSPADWSHQHLDRKGFHNWKQAKVLDLAPVIVLDVLFMLFGVVGNSIVCYICYFRLPRNVINSFVMALALVELLGCVFTIPVDITEIINAYSFNFPALCKIERYVRKFVVFSSGCVLIAIATERYKRIVKPYSRHVTMAEFRAAIFGALMVSALLSVPEAILAGNETVKTPHGKGTVCSTYGSDSYRHTVLPKLWGLTCVLIYVASATSIGAIYFAIASKIWKRDKVKTDQRSRAHTPDSTLQRRVVRTHPQDTLTEKQLAPDVYFTYSPKYTNKTGKVKRSSLPSTYLYTDKIRTLPREASNKEKPISATGHPVTHFIKELSPSAKAGGAFIDDERPYTFSGVVEHGVSVEDESSGSGFGHYQQRRTRHSDVHPQHRSRSTVFLEELVRSLSHRTQHRHHAPKKQEDSPLDTVHPLQPLTPMGSLRRRGPGYSRKRTTFIMFVMTLTTVLSHLPHITVMLYKLTHPGVDVSLQPDIHVMFKIMWNSYFISLATHPFVYGFWNGRFKHALFALFTGFSRSRLRLREQRESCSSNRHS